VILVSARAGEEARLEGLDAGADDYVVKPFSARELLARVGALLELTRMRRENEERFRAFVRATSEIIYRMSPDWTELRYLWGGNVVADIDAPKRNWLETYVPAEDQARLIAAVQAAIATRSVLQLEHRVRRARPISARPSSSLCSDTSCVTRSLRSAPRQSCSRAGPSTNAARRFHSM